MDTFDVVLKYEDRSDNKKLFCLRFIDLFVIYRAADGEAKWIANSLFTESVTL